MFALNGSIYIYFIFNPTFVKCCIYSISTPFYNIKKNTNCIPMVYNSISWFHMVVKYLDCKNFINLDEKSTLCSTPQVLRNIGLKWAIELIALFRKIYKEFVLQHNNNPIDSRHSIRIYNIPGRN